MWWHLNLLVISWLYVLYWLKFSLSLKLEILILAIRQVLLVRVQIDKRRWWSDMQLFKFYSDSKDQSQNWNYNFCGYLRRHLHKVQFVHWSDFNVDPGFNSLNVMAINYPEMVLQPLHYVGMFLQASKTFCAGWGQR